MENKHVGILIIGIAFIVGILVLIFNLSLKNIAEMSCAHKEECTMYGAMNSQLWISLSIVLIILIIGIVIMFTKPKEKIIVKIKKEKKKISDKKDIKKKEDLAKKQIERKLQEFF